LYILNFTFSSFTTTPQKRRQFWHASAQTSY
jgi:hypothetical protein